MPHTLTNINDQTFRDHINTINENGKRNWIYPQKPKGKLYNFRSLLSYFYLILFFSLPLIRINGSPLFLFNILERRFIFFGVTFWPQDFFIFGISMLTFILFIVLFTVVFGRIFCGWICPQTIFMEMVFRKIEYWIEGDANNLKVIDNAALSGVKILKKALKHIVFLIISFFISSTFLAYIIGTNELFKILTAPLHYMGSIIVLLIFTSIFYGVYSWFREQVCLIVCPYGRLQGVLTDNNTLLVAYDYIRGEPREKFKKHNSEKKGDCIDCLHCVKVCPTGIDIRNGTQLECINCTACIDACNHVMERLGYTKGLIRIDSENNIANGQRFKITPRILGYTGVLVVLLSVLVALLITRKDVDATILRTPGMLYQLSDNNMISNLYSIKLINKTHKDMPISLKLHPSSGIIKMVGKDLLIHKETKGESSFFILLPKKDIKQLKTVLYVELYSGQIKLDRIKITFIGPIS